MFVYHWVVFISSYVSSFVAGQDMKYLDELLTRVNYDKRVRPSPTGGKVNVLTQIDIQSLGPIDEKTNSFNIEYYIRHWWYDFRVHDNSTTLKVINTDIYAHNYFWVPKLTITNARSIKIFPSAVRTTYISNGNLYTSERFKALCSCTMDLRYYPHDTQTCHMEFTSYSYSSNEVSLAWHRTPLSKSKDDLNLDGYNIEDIYSEKATQIWSVGDVAQTFDLLLVHIKVARTFQYYVFRVFIPSILMIIFDMASYWIPISSVPGRVTLIVTTLLTSTFILQSVSEETVKIAYTTPLQLFLLVNVVFITISILEFVVVLMLKKREQRGTKVNPGFVSYNSDVNQAYNGPQARPNPTYKGERRRKTGENTGQNGHIPRELRVIHKANGSTERRLSYIVDMVFRVTIPILYFLFCCIYFVYYFYLV